MNHWITVCEFPVDRDLAELSQFIRSHRLPLRIAEENNRQIVSTPDPGLGDSLRPLLERWGAGEIQLADIRVQPLESAAGETPPQEETSAWPIPVWPLKQTPVCLLLIALCFLGWWLQSRGLIQGLVIFPQGPGDFMPAASTLAQHLAQGEYWRLWTPAIVHFSLPHALFNALCVWILGRPLEARAGSFAFAALVLISAPLANLSQYFWSPQSLFGGMSGVAYALVGAVFVVQRWQPRWRDVPPGIIALAVIWLLACAVGLVGFLLRVNIANAAHMGGFLSGMLLAFVYCASGGARNFLAAEYENGRA